MENFQTRYAHLLQPIKDLTKNWSVDVAAELEDYLSLVSNGEGMADPCRVKVMMVLDRTYQGVWMENIKLQG